MKFILCPLEGTGVYPIGGLATLSAEQYYFCLNETNQASAMPLGRICKFLAQLYSSSDSRSNG